MALLVILVLLFFVGMPYPLHRQRQSHAYGHENLQEERKSNKRNIGSDSRLLDLPWYLRNENEKNTEGLFVEPFRGTFEPEPESDVPELTQDEDLEHKNYPSHLNGTHSHVQIISFVKEAKEQNVVGSSISSAWNNSLPDNSSLIKENIHPEFSDDKRRKRSRFKPNIYPSFQGNFCHHDDMHSEPNCLKSSPHKPPTYQSQTFIILQEQYSHVPMLFINLFVITLLLRFCLRRNKLYGFATNLHSRRNKFTTYIQNRFNREIKAKRKPPKKKRNKSRKKKKNKMQLSPHDVRKGQLMAAMIAKPNNGENISIHCKNQDTDLCLTAEQVHCSSTCHENKNTNNNENVSKNESRSSIDAVLLSSPDNDVCKIFPDQTNNFFSELEMRCMSLRSQAQVHCLAELVSLTGLDHKSSLKLDNGSTMRRLELDFMNKNRKPGDQEDHLDEYEKRKADALKKCKHAWQHKFNVTNILSWLSLSLTSKVLFQNPVVINAVITLFSVDASKRKKSLFMVIAEQICECSSNTTPNGVDALVNGMLSNSQSISSTFLPWRALLLTYLPSDATQLLHDVISMSCWVPCFIKCMFNISLFWLLHLFVDRVCLPRLFHHFINLGTFIKFALLRSTINEELTETVLCFPFGILWMGYISHTIGKIIMDHLNAITKMNVISFEIRCSFFEHLGLTLPAFGSFVLGVGSTRMISMLKDISSISDSSIF